MSLLHVFFLSPYALYFLPNRKKPPADPGSGRCPFEPGRRLLVLLKGDCLIVGGFLRYCVASYVAAPLGSCWCDLALYK